MCDDDREQPDAELVANWKKGDESAGEELVRRYSPRLIHLAHIRGLSHQDAEDCVQNTWIRVWKSLDAYDEQDRLSVWLNRICLFSICQHFRINSTLKRGNGQKPLSLDADGGQNEDGYHRKIEPASREPDPDKPQKPGTKEWAERLAAPFLEDLYFYRFPYNKHVKTKVVEAHLNSEYTGNDELVICGAICKLPEMQCQCFVLKHWLDFSYEDIAKTLNISVHTVKDHLSKASKNLRQKISEAKLES